MKFLKIHDEYLEFLNWRMNNSLICLILGMGQLIITCSSLGQHIYSLIMYDQMLKCEFNSTIINPYLAMDIIIFDFGLFRRLWGIHQCIALYFDGGYMRFVWCIQQTLVILLLIISLIRKSQKSYALWPVLTVQSTYAIGLLILSISSLPKFLPSIFDQLGREAGLSMCIYLIGSCANFFHTYILWHYYWHIEAAENLPRPVFV